MTSAVTLNRGSYFFWWAAAHAAALGLWLVLASNLWPPVGEEHCPPGVGDAFYFLTLVLPLLFLGVTSAVTGAVISYRRRTQLGPSRHLLFWSCIVGAWVLAVVVDYSKAFRSVTDACPY